MNLLARRRRHGLLYNLDRICSRFRSRSCGDDRRFSVLVLRTCFHRLLPSDIILSYLILSYLVLSYLILSYLILSYLILSILFSRPVLLVLSYLVLSCLVLVFLPLSRSCLVLSCLVLSCLVLTQLSGADHGKCIARMFAGDTFGDKALNTDNPRSATIVSQEKSELIALERSDYQMFSKLDLLFSPKRCLDALRIAPHNRSPAEVEYVRVQKTVFSFSSAVPAVCCV
jgi:CRP-like cAMP-binding protein